MKNATSMTIREMKAAFASEWLLLAEPKTDKNLSVKSGMVIHHSKDRDELYRKAVSVRAKRSAILYTGKMAKNTAVVL